MEAGQLRLRALVYVHLFPVFSGSFAPLAARISMDAVSVLDGRLAQFTAYPVTLRLTQTIFQSHSRPDHERRHMEGRGRTHREK
jgi:hypothetical protein